MIDGISKDWLTQIGLSGMEQPTIPKIDVSGFDMTSIDKAREEKYKREVENNENIKELVNYNERISNYNEKLVSLNEKILSKIESLDDVLSFFNESFNKKTEFDKQKAIEQTALLLELTEIIETKDSNKLEKFINSVGAPISVAILIEYFKIKLGIS